MAGQLATASSSPRGLDTSLPRVLFGRGFRRGETCLSLGDASPATLGGGSSAGMSRRSQLCQGHESPRQYRPLMSFLPSILFTTFGTTILRDGHLSAIMTRLNVGRMGIR